jgi:hypothetical protein
LLIIPIIQRLGWKAGDELEPDVKDGKLIVFVKDRS